MKMRDILEIESLWFANDWVGKKGEEEIKMTQGFKTGDWKEGFLLNLGAQAEWERREEDGDSLEAPVWYPCGAAHLELPTEAQVMYLDTVYPGADDTYGCESM